MPDDEEPERKRRWPMIVTVIAVVVLLVLAAIIGQLLFNSGPDQKTVPQLVNMTQHEAEARIKQVGLSVGQVSKEASEDVPKNHVIAQDPDAMSLLPPGGRVDLTVSTGKPDVVVPYVIGDDKDTARQKMIDVGLRVRLVKKKSDQDQNTVVGTDPDPATSVSKGSLVTIFYSAGPHEVPSVVGLQEADARTKLQAAGFQVDTVLDSHTQSKRGTVLKQSPGAYTKQPQGTTVVITVSDYSTPTPTPTPTETPSKSPSSPNTASSSPPSP